MYICFLMRMARMHAGWLMRDGGMQVRDAHGVHDAAAGHCSHPRQGAAPQQRLHRCCLCWTGQPSSCSCSSRLVLGIVQMCCYSQQVTNPHLQKPLRSWGLGRVVCMTCASNNVHGLAVCAQQVCFLLHLCLQ